MPHLQELVKLHEDEPFAVIGINCYDAEDAYRKGLEDFGLSWISAYQGEGEAPIAELYQVQSFPTYYLIDADGTIVSRGPSGPALDAKIEELIEAAKKKRSEESREQDG